VCGFCGFTWYEMLVECTSRLGTLVASDLVEMEFDGHVLTKQTITKYSNSFRT
jgi:hypothetical protein